MKKILIVINNMNIGGIQKSLLELLKALSARNDISVSLFCCNNDGEFTKSIPCGINLTEQNNWAKLSELALRDCKTVGLKYYLFRIFASAWSKAFNKKLPAKLLCFKIGKMGEYDVAISYSQPINEKAFCTLTNEIVLNCCSARKKVTFVHCDYASYGGNTPKNRALYRKFDVIASVSDSVGRVLSECIPEVSSKVKTVYNFCDIDEIQRLSEKAPIEYAKKTIVTVARLSEEKGLVRCIPIMAKLKEQKLDFEWHIVGGGALENVIRNTISDYGMEKVIFLEGQQINPYRYMKNADYLFLPSFHEAAPVVFDEAIALKLPILTTDTLSAKELVSDRNAGMVCENSDVGIYNMLYSALSKNENKEENSKCTKLDMNTNMILFDETCL